MKAIILAAGSGTRLGKYTKDIPKCMLNFAGKTLIQCQFDVLLSVGIKDIVIVRGYHGEKVLVKGEARYIWNKDYADTNMVESMMRVIENEADGPCLVCYGDIIYEKRILDIILKNNSDIGCVVDDDWRDYWKLRFGDQQKDIESLVIGADGNITELGEMDAPLEKALVRYVGLIKFSKEGVKVVKDTYSSNKHFFKKAYMTDLLQIIISHGYKVFPIVISRGWLEFDTENDYEKMSLLYKKGELTKICNI